MDNQVKDTVLVVDDDGANLMLAQKILGKDYRMAAANSGANALRYLEKNQPDLILMDIKMPEMDGFQAVAQLKVDARYRAIPVIFLTADKDSETEKRCFQAGAVDFVTKPFIPDILLSRVARTLELAHYQKNLEQIVAEQTRQLEERARRISEMQDSVILGMANLIENRDNSTGRHVKNTQAYVKMIVERLQRERRFPELDGNAAADIVKAAPLHPPKAWAADRRRVHRHEAPHGVWRGNHRRYHQRRGGGELHKDRRADRALPPRAVGRQGIPPRPVGQRYPLGGPYYGGGRRL